MIHTITHYINNKIDRIYPKKYTLKNNQLVLS